MMALSELNFFKLSVDLRVGLTNKEAILPIEIMFTVF